MAASLVVTPEACMEAHVSLKKAWQDVGTVVRVWCHIGVAGAILVGMFMVARTWESFGPNGPPPVDMFVMLGLAGLGVMLLGVNFLMSLDLLIECCGRVRNTHKEYFGGPEGKHAKTPPSRRRSKKPNGEKL